MCLRVTILISIECRNYHALHIMYGKPEHEATVYWLLPGFGQPVEQVCRTTLTTTLMALSQLQYHYCILCIPFSKTMVLSTVHGSCIAAACILAHTAIITLHLHSAAVTISTVANPEGSMGYMKPPFRRPIVAAKQLAVVASPAALQSSGYI